ncbi:glycosyltransferase WbuB [bacterium]|nr:MAG: glycosyltransferase WbuB [bacterium]
MALTDLAETCAEAGFKVSVICSRYLYDHSGDSLPSFECNNGVEIHRVNQTNFGRHSNSGRLKDYASFFVNAAIQSFKLKPDIIVTLTTPPMLGILGWMHKLVRSVRFVYWSMDLHPEAEIAAGMISLGHPITSFIKKWHEKVLHSADVIVALSSNMKKRLLEYGLPEHKVPLISIWSDKDEIQALQQSSKKTIPEDWQQKCIVHYSGNLGLAHRYQSLLDVIELARNDEKLGFVFTGGGPQMPILKAKVQQLALSNVLFLPYVDRDELSESLSKAHIQWFSLDDSFEGIAYPSKLIGYMASGRPIIFLGDANADSAALIQKANCGFTFGLREPLSVLEHIRKLAANSDVQIQLGNHARTYFERHLTKEINTQKWISIVNEVLK